MRVTLTLVTGPSGEPVTLPEAKNHLRVDSVIDDVYISSLITAARGKVERDAQRQLLTATWEAVYESFPDRDTDSLEIPLPPLQSVTSVMYLDTDGILQTWPATDYLVEAPAGPQAREGRLAAKVAKSYPDTAALPGAVRVRFVAGYGAAAAVPEELKQAMKLLLGQWYGQRGEVSAALPLAYDALIALSQRMTATLA